MCRRAIAIASLALAALALAACQTTKGPASVAGACDAFVDPGFPVKGARDKDQRWITRTQETGIQLCGWPRPAPEKEVPTVAEVVPEPEPAVMPEVEQPAPRSRWRRWFGS